MVEVATEFTYSDQMYGWINLDVVAEALIQTWEQIRETALFVKMYDLAILCSYGWVHLGQTGVH